MIFQMSPLQVQHYHYQQIDVGRTSDKIEFGQFEISYLIDEDLLNYKEIFDWMKSM